MDFIFFSQPQIFNKLKYIYASKYESEWYVVEMQNLKFFQCGQVLHFQQFQICNVKKNWTILVPTNLYKNFLWRTLIIVLESSSNEK